MSDSSQPQNSWQNLINDLDQGLMITSSGSSSNSIYIDNTMSTTATSIDSGIVTIGSSIGSTYTIGPLTTDTITITGSDILPWNAVEWQDKFPEWHRVQDMCKLYPGLKNAFDNFKVFYELCKDDYDNPTPKK